MTDIRFIRALGILPLHRLARGRYPIKAGDLVIPESAFDNAMNLIPMSELNAWYQALAEQTQDDDIVLQLVKGLDITKMGIIGRWFFSGHDLAATIRRINYGLGSLQSGAYLTGSQTGTVIKWSYQNPFVDPHVKVHDSIRVAMFMTKVLREYLGADFSPQRVMLSGVRANQALYEDYFGCEVEWSHKQTEIWLHSSHRQAELQVNKRTPKPRLAMSFSELDQLLNMPEPGDELKVIYEVINYSRYYGLPTLNRVAGLLGLSEQQLQRRLHALELNFTTVVGYVLTNVAAELMSHFVPIEQISQRLGYSNVESFNRMFKKHRGITPKQYIQQFEMTSE